MDRILGIALTLLPLFSSTVALSQESARPRCDVKMGIYLQEDPMTKAHNAGQLGEIVKARGAGLASEVELGLVKPLSFAQWAAIWKDAGLDPKEDNVIIDFKNDKHWAKDFPKAVEAGKKIGMRSIAPIFSPNGDSLPLDSWSKNKYYAEIRKAALIGNGLVLDPPPGYFFKRGAAYQEFTYQQVRWAREHHIRSTVIISPYGDDGYFLKDVQKYVALFAAHDAVPTEWALENYNSSVGNAATCERSPDSVAGTSAWLATSGPAMNSDGEKAVHPHAKRAAPAVVVFQGIPPHL